MRSFLHSLTTMATAAAVAFVVFSCSGKLKQAQRLNLDETPVQTIENMFAVQSTNGGLESRIEAPKMEKYEKDTATIDVFPEGISVFGYKENGLLESVIISDKARHIKSKRHRYDIWIATGNVSVQNVINQQTLESDTLYWDQSKGEIYTDSYVRMYSSDGFMQGYGMHSDDRARNAIIHRPFNSYGYVTQDTTAVALDSANFIGPFPKK